MGEHHVMGEHHNTFESPASLPDTWACILLVCKGELMNALPVLTPSSTHIASLYPYLQLEKGNQLHCVRMNTVADE